MPAIFDDHSSISRIYRKLRCQHHLIQGRDNQKPDIPCLTPAGFERWVTLLIQAHPEEEYKRLQKVILNVPISNPNNIRERFPKEIPRTLFPGHEDSRIRDHIEYIISEYAALEQAPDLNEGKLQHPGNPLFRTQRNDKQFTTSQHRRVRFILPQSHTYQDLDESRRKGAEGQRQFCSDDTKRYRNIPGFYGRVGFDNKLPLRRIS